MVRFHNKPEGHTPELEKESLTYDDFEADLSKNRQAFYTYLEQTYHPKIVYYAGSGFDRLPKDTLGEGVVINLSLESFYFHKLGSGQKVIGDFRMTPFADQSSDMVILRGTPFQDTLEALPEFKRVLKPDGLLLVDNVWDSSKQLEIKLGGVRKLFAEETLPAEISNPPDKIRCFVKWQKDKDGQKHDGGACFFTKNDIDASSIIKDTPTEMVEETPQYFAAFRKI